MAKYFSRFEREAFMVMICSFDRMSAWARDPKTCLNDEERQKLEKAVDDVQDIFTGLADRLDVKYLEKIASDIKNIQIILEPKRVTEQLDESRIKTDNLETIADFALWRCQSDDKHEGCQREDWRECLLYKALMDCSIPVANLDTENCPYKL